MGDCLARDKHYRGVLVEQDGLRVSQNPRIRQGFSTHGGKMFLMRKDFEELERNGYYED